jgi:hypothetical protein
MISHPYLFLSFFHELQAKAIEVDYLNLQSKISFHDELEGAHSY